MSERERNYGGRPRVGGARVHDNRLTLSLDDETAAALSTLQRLTGARSLARAAREAIRIATLDAQHGGVGSALTAALSLERQAQSDIAHGDDLGAMRMAQARDAKTAVLSRVNALTPAAIRAGYLTAKS